MSHGLTLADVISVLQHERLALLHALESVRSERRLQQIEDLAVAFRGNEATSKGHLVELIKTAYRHDPEMLAIRLEAATRRGS